jgi:23S rRNA (cytidine1920-2'-O)/16S rRNA (cytidine1409-2'-O)-methyltransferase
MKERIDKLLVERQLADSRTKAQALIMSGIVLVDDRRVDKPSECFESSSTIRLKGGAAENRYVSRGGLKLEAALREFSVDPTGWNCIDIGSSTGGFTDCLLQHGAESVVAVDAGTNQLVWKLRSDPRIKVRENTNARFLKPQDFASPFDLAVIDASFISLTKLMPAVVPLVREGGLLIALIKPQFEVGKGEVGKGGIVRDPQQHERVVREVNQCAASLGLQVKGLIDSPILGAEGNKEFLACYERR